MEESIARIGNQVLNVGIIVIVAAVILGILGVAFWFYLKWRKYQQFTCRIWEKDGFGQLNETIDKAGVFVDKKTHNKRLFLKKHNVGLNPDSIPYIPTKKGKIIYLFKTGLKNFSYVKPTLSNPSLSLQVGEEDVNWAVNTYERQKKLFAPNTLLQYMPFILLGFVSIIILVIFIYFFKNFEVLEQVAVAFNDAAGKLALSNTGTAVIS